MKKLKLHAFAKANLALDITGKRNDMHTIDTVMVSVDAFDTVTVCERADDEITVRFDTDKIDAQNNTAYKAAALVRDVIGCGADITVEKGIPLGAGLGGSSADGAAVLRALDLFYDLPAHGVKMRDTALKVGSDVPFMLTGGLARVTGIGEELFFIENKLTLFAIGLMDDFVSAAAAYKKYDELKTEHHADMQKLTDMLLDGDNNITAHLSNALYEPVKALAPSVGKIYDKLLSVGAAPCMTGSGGMVLGYFNDISAFAAAAAKLKGENGFRALTTAPTGILHEWIER